MKRADVRRGLIKVASLALCLVISLLCLEPAGYVPALAAETGPQGITSGSTVWRYLDDGSDPAAGLPTRTAWTLPNYDDSAWKSAAGSFGAKNGAIADLGGGCTPTNLLNQYKSDGRTNIEAFFFRTTVYVDDPSSVSLISGSLRYDDGAIVYINGVRAAAFDDIACDANGNSLGHGFDANLQYGGSNAAAPKTGAININDKNTITSMLRVGENIVAVELHQGRASSSDIYMDFISLTFEGERPIEQNSVSLAPGPNETMINLTWYASDSNAGSVRWAELSELINGKLPENASSVVASVSVTNRSGYYTNKATISGLKPSTSYAYQLINGDTVSPVYTFTTGRPGGFKFLFMGDPQLGASGNLSSDKSGWANTLAVAVAKVPDAAFLLTAGDQVDTASSEDQYSAYLEHAQLKGLPNATVIGNHDSGSNAYSQHFNVANASTQYGLTTAGGDSWFRYNDALFMILNVNNMSAAEHRAFMESAISLNQDAKWRIVAMHHSVYSVASHADDTDILQRRSTLVPIFKELGIDVVLQGHDHVYVRSYMMDGLNPVTDPEKYDSPEMTSITNTDYTLYITANSASGSKYYTIKNVEYPYAAVKNQERIPNFSEVYVSDTQFSITTYRVNDLSIVDKFTIYRTGPVSLSNDASITQVLGEDVTWTGTGTTEDPKRASIDVESGVEEIATSDITAAEGATVAFTESDFTTAVSSPVALNVGENTVYIKVTAEDGETVLYYAVTINKYGVVIDREADGGIYKTREITITANSLEGKTLVVKLQHGRGTSADVHVFTITPQSNVVTVSYNKQLTEIEVWLIEGTPDLTEENLGTAVYAHAAHAQDN